MKTRMKTAVAVFAALLAVALSGCGDDAAPESGETFDVQSRSQSVKTETPEPLVAESPAPEASEADARFLDYVRSELLPTTQIADATDEQLIAAGHEGCEQVKAGVPLEEIRLVEGEEPSPTGYYLDTSAIFSGAQLAYCPETIQQLED